MGRVDQNYFSIEASGIITSIGSNVSELAVGDRVTCFGEGNYGTYKRTPASLCVKLEDGETFTVSQTGPWRIGHRLTELGNGHHAYGLLYCLVLPGEPGTSSAWRGQSF